MVDKLLKTESLVYESIFLNTRLSQPELALKCGVGKTTVKMLLLS